MSLNELPIGQEAVIDRLDVDEVDAALLRAMGLAEGESVSVLRAGALGGPLHVRVSGAAFAMGRDLCRHVRVHIQAGGA